VRALLAVALSVLLLVAAGCGGGGSTGVASGATLGSGAAQLVPADAAALVSLDSNLDSAQWQRVDDLTKGFPARAKLLDDIRSELQKRGLSWQDDVAPALGDELDVAVLGTGKNQEYVAYAKPDDVAKLRTLATKLSEGSETYTVEQIGGWSVVADSQDLFDAVRTAENGRSLADVAAFDDAWASVSGDALARAYVSGKALADQPKALRLAKLTSQADWFAARVAADGDALRLEIARHPQAANLASKRPALLGDVPSGASLAVAFHGGSDLLAQLPATKLGSQLPLKQLAPLLTGDGVLYVRSSGLLPLFALEVAPKDPQAALAAARTVIQSLGGKLGLVPLSAQLVGGKVVLSDGPAAAAALRSGPKLVDDSTFKDAISSAGAPAQTTYLAYADVTELAPVIQLLAQALGSQAADQNLGDNLEHVGTVVAWGSKESGLTRLHLWVQPH
jgi:Protein of unknown function (DUF3352)